MNLLVADLQDLIGRSVGDSIKVEIRHSSAKLHRLVERHRLIANAPPIALKHERAKWDAQWRGRLRSNCHWNSSGREGLSDAHRSLQVQIARKRTDGERGSRGRALDRRRHGWPGLARCLRDPAAICAVDPAVATTDRCMRARSHRASRRRQPLRPPVKRGQRPRLHPQNFVR